MGGIQKLNKTRTFSVIIGGVLLFAFLGIFTPADTAKAVGNCPGSQVQGSATNGKDTTKCYNVTQNRSGNSVYVETNDTPAGQTPATPATPNSPSTPAAQNPADATADPADGTTCAVEKIGWILCPVIETAATVADKTFSLLANNFLQVDPRLLADQGAKPAWEQARNLANIMFVIAFLAIIYSQITGSGLNNYGIKRMLPRLIIAAIAVNVSYYICQIMVDISNIMGFAIKEGLATTANEIGPSILSGSAQGLNTETSGGVLSYIAIAALALAGFIWLILGPLALIITTVVVTAATIIAILLLRKAILILLVVISPIAFVLYLLPNTEKLFDKWLKMFWGLLMVFPVVALLFGSGQLASTIILMAGSAPEQYQDTTEECVERKEQEAAGLSQAEKDDKAVNDGFTLPCEKGFTVTSIDSPGKTAQSGMMLGLVATGIAVAPLLAVWAVLKGALSAAGAIGGRIAAGVQKGAGGAGSLGNKAYEKSAFGRGQAIRKAAKENYKNRKFGENLAAVDPSDSRFKKMRKRYTRAAAGGVPGVLNSTGVGGGAADAQASALRRSAMSQNMKAEQEDISGAQAELQYSTRGDMGQIANKLAEAIRDGNEIQAKAAENMLMGMGGGGVDAFASAIIRAEQQSPTANSSHVLTELKQHTGQHHGGIKEKSGDLNQWMSSDYSTSDTGQRSGGLQSFSRSPNAFSGLSDDQIATQSHASLHAAFASDALDHRDATRILESTSAAKLGGAQRQMLTELATNRGPNAASSIAPRHAPTDTTRRV